MAFYFLTFLVVVTWTQILLRMEREVRMVLKEIKV